MNRALRGADRGDEAGLFGVRRLDAALQSAIRSERPTDPRVAAERRCEPMRGRDRVTGGYRTQL